MRRAPAQLGSPRSGAAHLSGSTEGHDWGGQLQACPFQKPRTRTQRLRDRFPRSQVSAASSLAKTFKWSLSPTSLCRIDVDQDGVAHENAYPLPG